MTNADKITKLDTALGLLLDAEEELQGAVSKLKTALSYLNQVDRNSTVAGQLEVYTIGNIKAFLTDEHNQAGNICSIIDTVEDWLRKTRRDFKKELEKESE